MVPEQYQMQTKDDTQDHKSDQFHMSPSQGCRNKWFEMLELHLQGYSKCFMSEKYYNIHMIQWYFPFGGSRPDISWIHNVPNMIVH